MNNYINKMLFVSYIPYSDFKIIVLIKSDISGLRCWNARRYFYHADV